MMRWLKNWVKALPYPVLIRIYYFWCLLLWLPRYERARIRGRFPRLGNVDLSKLKNSDTLFVLASGPSINSISVERWRAIARSDSIGFNFWLYHPFVPKMYFFESTSPWQGSGETAASLHRQVWQRWLDISARRAADYADVTKVVMDLVHSGHQYVFDASPEFRRNLCCAYTLPLAARTDAEFVYALNYLKIKGAFRPAARINFLFKHHATLSALIVLGVRMRYRRIVLCGVDLRDTRRFYQDPILFPETKDLNFYPVSTEQGITALDRFAWGDTPIDVVLGELNRHVLQPEGIELYVENPHSALYPLIPAAPDSLFDEINHAAGALAGAQHA